MWRPQWGVHTHTHTRTSFLLLTHCGSRKWMPSNVVQIWTSGCRMVFHHFLIGQFSWSLLTYNISPSRRDCTLQSCFPLLVCTSIVASGGHLSDILLIWSNHCNHFFLGCSSIVNSTVSFKCQYSSTCPTEWYPGCLGSTSFGKSLAFWCHAVWRAVSVNPREGLTADVELMVALQSV